jgi:glycosyltransferase involved in cell wall biosynthesis
MHFTIVSYTFPPSNEIGGRRWAKFSKQLKMLGHEVTIICSGNDKHNNFYNEHYSGIEVRVLPKKYPNWLSGLTNSFFEKILYFLYTQLLSKFTSQNFFDRAYKWQKSLLNELDSVHQNKPINVLICSGGPFSILFYGALFKQRNKEIIYVADLRDPWTWGSLYGIPNLDSNKMKFQQLSERITVENCDVFACPTQNMIDFLKYKYNSFSSKFYLLPHAYDPDKFSFSKVDVKREGFIYGGTLYSGIENYLKTLAGIVSKNPNSGFKWKIYTSSFYPLLDELFDKSDLNKFSLVTEDILFDEIRKSAAYLAFYPETDKDLISTKFFEIMYTGTPILYIGEEGDVAKFIRDARAGVHILPKNMETELPPYLSGNVPFEKDFFDVKKYSFPRVTQKFVDDLNVIMDNKKVKFPN